MNSNIIKCCILLCLLFVQASCSGSREKKEVHVSEVTNPLPIKLGDPFILHASDGKYYMYGTSLPDGFEAYVSTDLSQWTACGQVYKGGGEEQWNVDCFWAPDSLIDRVDESRAILVVEDNAEMRLFIEKQLYKQGYKVYSASNGAEALQVLAGQDINLIITDLMMPEVDGITLLKKVKTDLMYCHIPVIILSAKTAVADKIEGLESGADAYIDKPFSMQYLLANVATLIRNRQRLREALSNTSANSVARNEGLSKMDKEFLTRLDEIVQANYSNPDFAMDDIVEAMNMSRSSFYRKLKGVLNLSINDYVRLQRLKRAPSC